MRDMVLVDDNVETEMNEMVASATSLTTANATVAKCVSALRAVDKKEKIAIEMIKQSSDYERGALVHLLKVSCLKEQVKFETVVKEKLGYTRTMADNYQKVYDMQSNFVKLKENLNESKSGKVAFNTDLSLDQLYLPDTATALKNVEGVDIKAVAGRLIHEAKKDGKEMSKEEALFQAEYINIMEKAFNHTTAEIAKVSDDLEKYSLKIVDGVVVPRKTKTGTESKNAVEPYSKTIKALQEKVDSFSDVMLKKRMSTANNHLRRNEFFKENGWTKEDALLWTKLKTERATSGFREQLANDLINSVDDWKKVYKELSKFSHPDTGGSHELQLFVNGLNTAMLKASKLGKIKELDAKYDEIGNRFSKVIEDEDDNPELEFAAVMEVAIESLKEEYKKNKDESQ